jgi:hypothetical protein
MRRQSRRRRQRWRSFLHRNNPQPRETLEMPTLPRLDSRKLAGKVAALPKVRGTMAPTEGRAEQSSLSGPATGRAASREQGIAKILSPAVDAGEGARILIYGRTRSGKSTFAVDLCEAMLAAHVARTVLVHDVKYPDRSQYTGRLVNLIQRVGPAVREEADTLILRPPFTAADAANCARAISEAGEPTALLVDETRRALGGSQKWIDADGPEGPGRGPRNFEWLCLEGGGVGASLVLLVQRPRQVPGDAVDSAQVSVVFGLGGRSLAYLIDAGTVPRDAGDTIRRLQPGAFCVFADDDDWDRVVYYSPL